MMEMLEVFDLNGNYIENKDRSTFYSGIKEEYSKSGKISRQIKNIRVMILTSKGKIYLQKRSKQKEENAGLFDKTVGGHVRRGETFDTAVVRECAEELGFPVSVLSAEEFEMSVKSTNLSVVGVLKKMEHINQFNSRRIADDGTRFIQPSMTMFYFGYYDGHLRFMDGESSAIEVFTAEELENEVRKDPGKFTEDIKFMLQRYRNHIKPVVKPKPKPPPVIVRPKPAPIQLPAHAVRNRALSEAEKTLERMARHSREVGLDE